MCPYGRCDGPLEADPCSSCRADNRAGHNTDDVWYEL